MKIAPPRFSHSPKTENLPIRIKEEEKEVVFRENLFWSRSSKSLFGFLHRFFTHLYDFNLTHYHFLSRGYLADVSGPSISQFPEGVFLWPLSELSERDIAALNHMYPHIPPNAILDKKLYRELLGISIFMDGRSSYSFGGENLTCNWDLGDGTIVNNGLPYANHLYTSKGTYKVTLTVVDSKGGSDKFESKAFVYEMTDLLIPILTYTVLM